MNWQFTGDSLTCDFHCMQIDAVDFPTEVLLYQTYKHRITWSGYKYMIYTIHCPRHALWNTSRTVKAHYELDPKWVGLDCRTTIHGKIA